MKVMKHSAPTRLRTWGRRLVAMALVFLPLQGFVSAAFASGDTHKHGTCTDHVCACVRHCPPKKAAAHSCHESAPVSPLAFEPGRCQHGGTGTAAPVVAPHIVPATVETGAAFVTAPAVVARPSEPRRGFLHVDRKPPRDRA
jgi:hypothetical protein